MADTRRDRRAPVSLKVRFKSATVDEFVEHYAMDISRGGIFIKSKSPMPVGTLLKFEGKLIFQTRTDGPVDMLVADFSTPHSLRAYARFDEERLKAAIKAGETSPEQLLGVGVLALTIDQGAHTNRYQGIVQLDGKSLDPDPITNAVSGELSAEYQLAAADAQQASSKAVDSYRKIAAVTPRDPNVQLELAQAAQGAGDFATAATAYEAFLRLAPNDPTAPEVKRILRQLRQQLAPAG